MSFIFTRRLEVGRDMKSPYSNINYILCMNEEITRNIIDYFGIEKIYSGVITFHYNNGELDEIKEKIYHILECKKIITHKAKDFIPQCANKEPIIQQDAQNFSRLNRFLFLLSIFKPPC